MNYIVGKVPSPTGFHNIKTWAKVDEALSGGAQSYDYLCGVAFDHGCGSHIRTYNWTPARRGVEFIKYAIKSRWLVEV